jgi:hypothetical protein
MKLNPDRTEVPASYHLLLRIKVRYFLLSPPCYKWTFKWFGRCECVILLPKPCSSP